MEIRTDILRQLTRALTPGLQSPASVADGQPVPSQQAEGIVAAAGRPAQLENVAEALRSGDGGLILSAQEKNILEVLFLNQADENGASGFRLYRSQPPAEAMRGSFVDLKG